MRSIVLLIPLLAASDASAFRVSLDAGALGDSGAMSIVSMVRCGINITIAQAGDAVTVTEGGGVGVRGGGSNDADIDGGEALNFSLPAASRGLTYAVSSASNADGDALPGETFVRASDGAELGIEAISGVGTIDLSAAFGGASIGGFTVTSAPDGVRIGRISYDAPPVPVAMRLARVEGSVAVAELVHCGVTFRGSMGFAHHGTGGVAVTGGNATSYIDPGEALEVDFGEPIAGLRYELDAVEVVNPSAVGGHFVEAFDAQGNSLGVQAASALDWIDLSTLFGDAPIARFTLIATGDQIRLTQIEMVPEADGVGVAGVVALVWLRWRRGDARRAADQGSRRCVERIATTRA